MPKKRFDKVCSVCKKEYKYCSQCSDFDHLPRWMDAYCSQNCKDLYNIAAGWLNGWKDKDVEIDRLNNIDLSKMNDYPQWLKDVIKDMNLYIESKKVDNKKAESLDANIDVIEDAKTDDVMTKSVKLDSIEKKENNKNEKKNYNYKKNYKK